MHVANNVVQVFLINDDFALAAVDKHLHQFLERSVGLHGYNFGAGHDAVADTDVGKAQGIAEYLHVVLADVGLGGRQGGAQHGVHKLSAT